MNQEPIEQRLRRRGEFRFHELIRESGGVYSQWELAVLLNKGPGKIAELAQTRQLICFKTVEDEWLFPRVQFHGAELIAGVREILAAFRSDQCDRDMVVFFLSRYERTGQTPLSLLKQDQSCLERLIDSARTLYEHGAQ